jgi:hypothetical protein
MTTHIVMCIECTRNEAWSRGLCHTCYSYAQRHGILHEYPTKAYMADPEAHIRWAFGHHPELVADVAIEFGKRVTP